jgi:hypothetical protein
VFVVVDEEYNMQRRQGGAVEQRRSMVVGRAQSSISIAIQFELTQTWANLLILVIRNLMNFEMGLK